MKIGILTFHRAHNYGAVLQAYAMKYNYSAYGDTELIDYWPDYHGVDYDLFDKRFLNENISFMQRIKFFKSSIKRLMLAPIRLERHRKFKDFIDTHFINSSDKVIADSKSLPKDFDIYVYGSDQIWRVYDMTNYPKPDLTYLGKNIPKGVRTIAYAASMGKVNYETLEDKEVSNLLIKFDYLGVRERSLMEAISSIHSINVQQVLDPTFLVPKKHWEKMISDVPRVCEEPYLLFYSLINSVESRKLANRICKEKGLKLIEINGFETFSGHFDSQLIQSAGPIDFLKLIYDAEYVVSTSFHGVVFSILFEKNFFACGMGDHVARVSSLLEILDLEERLVESSTTKINSVDYSHSRIILNSLIDDSKLFIKKSVL
ncbi:polysaccharide pyruvyl transferase family protein [Photobacterium damselae subsp. damselae]|uniref:polysaccharide pyruvyl transferase family protein n=1 Tax=Photobacterium damselae TaxID=38293 RepID=UPI001F177C8B|nr:polysaccharide pyruvyl transferase family protein [Photobacterium damselae]UKA26079.1 polysaccharide pyruvyl transferase family protein [Photobacterium damselae subsp. damselae]